MGIKKVIIALAIVAVTMVGAQPVVAADNHFFVYLIRHGQSVDNASGLQSGWSLTPLTALGTRQATAIGVKLKTGTFVLAISSGSPRAVQTLELINAQLPVPMTLETDPRFREWGVGSFEQKPVGLVQVTQAKKLKTALKNLWKFNDTQKFDALAAADPTKKAETFAKFKARIVAGLKALPTRVQSGSIILTTHGYVIKHLIKQITGKYTSLPIGNASVTVLEYTGGKWFVRQGPTVNPVLTPQP